VLINKLNKRIALSSTVHAPSRENKLKLVTV